MITSLEILSIIPDEIKSEEVKEYERQQIRWKSFWSEALQNAADNTSRQLEEDIFNIRNDTKYAVFESYEKATEWYDELVESSDGIQVYLCKVLLTTKADISD